MKTFTVAAAALLAGTASVASAQSDTDATTPLPVIGTVPALCTGGTLAGGDAFDLGVLIDVNTGYLRTDLSTEPKVLTGSFCSARSTISVVATPISAQNFTATPPNGFSRQVDYTATASGWTPTAAVYNTADATHPAATQQRDAAFTGDITVSIGDFSTVGGNALRMVADPSYRGMVTVTLAVAD